jgi:hypothetical protein
MSKSRYTVPMVAKDLNGTQPEIGDSGRTVLVGAYNMNMAVQIAETQNPGYVAIREAIQRQRRISN